MCLSIYYVGYEKRAPLFLLLYWRASKWLDEVEARSLLCTEYGVE